jgi:hypothetical protein
MTARYRRYDKAGKLVQEIVDGRVTVGLGLGDKIALIATPIARALGSDCIDKTTGQLKPTSGCGKMKGRVACTRHGCRYSF